MEDAPMEEAPEEGAPEAEAPEEEAPERERPPPHEDPAELDHMCETALQAVLDRDMILEGAGIVANLESRP